MQHMHICIYINTYNQLTLSESINEWLIIAPHGLIVNMSQVNMNCIYNKLYHFMKIYNMRCKVR